MGTRDAAFADSGFLLRATCGAVILSLALSVSAGREETLSLDFPQCELRAASWPAADRLFRSDPSWLGGDVAYSVDLGYGRILWLFGDSFIARSHMDGVRSGRRGTVMIHNSIGIQVGYDPAHAKLSFFWNQPHHLPGAFFKAKKGGWLWPMDGVMIQDHLYLFFSQIRRANPAQTLGFRIVGYEAIEVDNPQSTPDEWKVHLVSALGNPWNLIDGVSVLATDRYLYAFAFSEPSHDAYLVRWSISDRGVVHFNAPEWWHGAHLWRSQGQKQEAPSVAIKDASSEFTVRKLTTTRGYVQVQSVGFGASDVKIRWASDLEGPWSSPRLVFRPPESDRPNAFVYAAKQHIEQRSDKPGTELILTYVSNGPASILMDDMSIYYPRFVRVACQ